MATHKKKFCFILALLLILLSGCTKAIKETEYVTKPVEVYVPVMETAAIKPIPRPILEISTLTDESKPATVAEAYYNSLQQLIQYSKKLELALGPFFEEYEKKHGTQSIIQQ